MFLFLVLQYRGWRKGGPVTQYFRINENKCVFNKRTIKVCNKFVLDSVVGPLRLARHT